MKNLLRHYVVTSVLTILISTGLSYNAYSELIYAVDGARDNPASLHTFDLETGQFIQTIGPVGFSHVTSIAFHPQTGELYGVVSDLFDSGFTALIHIDINTGAGTEIGPTNGQIPDIDFSWDGTLYGWNESGDDLYTIDLNDGSITLVGPGFSTAATGLAFDSFDNLYVKEFDTLHTVNENTGASTGSTFLDHCLSNMLTVYTAKNVMYSGANSQNCENQIVIIDPISGQVTVLATHNLDFLSGLAIMKQPFSRDVPTLSQWGLIATAALLGIIGFLVIRRRQLTTNS